MGACYVDPTREADCHNCHSVSCNKEQAEYYEYHMLEKAREAEMEQKQEQPEEKPQA